MAGHEPQKLTVEEARKKGIILKKKKIKENNTVYFKTGTPPKKNKTGFFDFFTVFR